MDAINAHDFTYLENVDDTFIGSHGNYSTTPVYNHTVCKRFSNEVTDVRK